MNVLDTYGSNTIRPLERVEEGQDPLLRYYYTLLIVVVAIPLLGGRH